MSLPRAMWSPPGDALVLGLVDHAEIERLSLDPSHLALGAVHLREDEDVRVIRVVSLASPVFARERLVFCAQRDLERTAARRFMLAANQCEREIERVPLARRRRDGTERVMHERLAAARGQPHEPGSVVAQSRPRPHDRERTAEHAEPGSLTREREHAHDGIRIRRRVDERDLIVPPALEAHEPRRRGDARGRKGDAVPLVRTVDTDDRTRLADRTRMEPEPARVRLVPELFERLDGGATGELRTDDRTVARLSADLFEQSPPRGRVQRVVRITDVGRAIELSDLVL